MPQTYEKQIELEKLKTKRLTTKKKIWKTMTLPNSKEGVADREEQGLVIDLSSPSSSLSKITVCGTTY